VSTRGKLDGYLEKGVEERNFEFLLRQQKIGDDSGGMWVQILQIVLHCIVQWNMQCKAK